MTNFSAENLNAGTGGPKGGGMDSRHNVNQVAEMSAQYLVEASGAVPIGFKQSEIGVIPEDWLIEQLENFTSFISYGFTNPMPTTHSGPYMVTARDISEGKIQYKSARNTDIEAFNKLLTSKSKPKKNDILLTKDGTLGRLALVEDELICINQSVAILRPNQRIMPTFFKLLLESPYYQERMIEEAGGSTIKHIYITIVNRMPLAVPQNLKEQTAIANALSDVDALIRELEKLIAKKQAIKTATMQQLLTGRTRLPQFALREDGTKKGYKQSELGEVPEDWEVFNLPEVIWYQEGPGLRKWQFKSKGLKVINVTNLQENGWLDLDRTDRHISWDEFEKTYKHFSCDEGDLVIASSGNSYCKTSVVRACDLPLLMNTSVIRFKPIGDFSKGFMAVYLKSTYFKDQIDLLITGGAQPNFGPAHLNRIQILAPNNEEEQTAIANILSDMDSDIQTLEQRLNKTRHIKQGMMQELLTGKTRLI